MQIANGKSQFRKRLTQVRRFAATRRTSIDDFHCAWSISHFLSLLLALVVSSSAAAQGTTDAIESGREALQGRTHYPWYDAETDGVRRVNVTPVKSPPPPTNPNWKWPEWKGWNTNWSFADIFWTVLQVLFWGVLVVLLVGLVILLAKVFLGRESALAVSSEGDRSIETGAGADRIEHLPFEVRRPQGDLLAEARRLYEQGEFSQAIVYYFSYLLVELDRRQVIRLTRGKTNRQYLREVRRQRQEIAALVERTMVAFEDVFFGDHALNRERFESCWSGLETFQKQLQQTA